MEEPLDDISGNLKQAQSIELASGRASGLKNPWRRYITILASFAMLSSAAGFLVGRYKGDLANWLESAPVRAASSNPEPALVPASNPRSNDNDVEEISRLAPQQQAERLLELAIRRPDLSLDLIHRNLTAWRGHLEDTEHLFQLVLAALDSNDPRVRVAAVEIDLAANNLIKSRRASQSFSVRFRAIATAVFWRYGV
jgi:hypothetical protein